MIINKTDGLFTIDGQDLTGKVIILHDEELGDNFQDPKYQFWIAQGGFGCSPFTIGKAVIAEALIDKEVCRWARDNFIGIASPELIAQYFPDYK